MKTLRDRLIYARELRGWSQGELAARAKCSQGTIGNIESGERKTLRNLVEVARALNVSPDWLYDGKGPKPTKHSTLVAAEAGPRYVTHAEATGSAFVVANDDPAAHRDRTAPDKYTQAIIDLVAGLKDEQKLAALAKLREFTAFLDPPSNQLPPAPISKTA